MDRNAHAFAAHEFDEAFISAAVPVVFIDILAVDLHLILDELHDGNAALLFQRAVCACVLRFRVNGHSAHASADQVAVGKGFLIILCGGSVIIHHMEGHFFVLRILRGDHSAELHLIAHIGDFLGSGDGDAGHQLLLQDLTVRSFIGSGQLVGGLFGYGFSRNRFPLLRLLGNRFLRLGHSLESLRDGFLGDNFRRGGGFRGFGLLRDGRLGGFHSHSLRLGFHFLRAGRHGNTGQHAQDQDQGQKARYGSFDLFHKLVSFTFFLMVHDIISVTKNPAPLHRKLQKITDLFLCMLPISAERNSGTPLRVPLLLFRSFRLQVSLFPQLPLDQVQQFLRRGRHGVVMAVVG